MLLLLFRRLAKKYPIFYCKFTVDKSTVQPAVDKTTAGMKLDKTNKFNVGC